MTVMRDLAGQRFGMLVAIRRAGYNGHFVTWEFVCDCGRATTKVGVDVTQSARKGRVPNCGCKTNELLGSGNRRHMASKSAEYVSWKSAKGRCINPKHHAWARYGGKGITMCSRWMNSFDDFLADMGPRPPDSSLDRIDNNGPYEPANCRWATRKEQASNRANSKHVLVCGVSTPITLAAKILDIPLSTLSKRVSKGWTGDRLFQKSKNRSFPRTKTGAMK